MFTANFSCIFSYASKRSLTYLQNVFKTAKNLSEKKETEN